MNNIVPNIVIGLLLALLIVSLSYIAFTEQPLSEMDCGDSVGQCEEIIDIDDILLPQ